VQLGETLHRIFHRTATARPPLDGITSIQSFIYFSLISVHKNIIRPSSLFSNGTAIRFHHSISGFLE
jgi:hypothetical protein